MPRSRICSLAATCCVFLNVNGIFASETIDIVFVIDGSDSITSEGFTLEKQGIANCLVGLNAFIPTDGSVAIAVVQFSTYPTTDAPYGLPLTVIQNVAVAEQLASEIANLQQLDEYTYLADAIEFAIDVLREDAVGSERLIVISTDLPPEEDDLEPGSIRDSHLFIPIY